MRELDEADKDIISRYTGAYAFDRSVNDVERESRWGVADSREAAIAAADAEKLIAVRVCPVGELLLPGLDEHEVRTVFEEIIMQFDASVDRQLGKAADFCDLLDHGDGAFEITREVYTLPRENEGAAIAELRLMLNAWGKKWLACAPVKIAHWAETERVSGVPADELAEETEELAAYTEGQASNALNT